MYSTTYLILQWNIDQSWRQNKTQILPHHCPFQLVRHCQNKKLQGWDIRGGVGFIAASKLWISWSYLGLTGQTEEQDKYQLNSHVKTTSPALRSPILVKLTQIWERNLKHWELTKSPSWRESQPMRRARSRSLRQRMITNQRSSEARRE